MSKLQGHFVPDYDRCVPPGRACRRFATATRRERASRPFVGSKTSQTAPNLEAHIQPRAFSSPLGAPNLLFFKGLYSKAPNPPPLSPAQSGALARSASLLSLGFWTTIGLHQSSLPIKARRDKKYSAGKNTTHTSRDTTFLFQSPCHQRIFRQPANP